MSKFEMYDDTCFIFKNEDKLNPPKRDDGTVPDTSAWPDYRGKIKVGGKERSIGLWIRHDKNNKPFFSGKVSDFTPMPDDVKAAAYDQSSVKPQVPDIDDVPF